MSPPIPGLDAALEIAGRAIPEKARVLVVGAGDGAVAALADDGRRDARALPEGEALLAALEADPEKVDAVFCPFPARLAPFIPLLQALRERLEDGGTLVVSDLVWQTAPTPELVQAFLPEAGRERVRPVEGFDMQVEHAGFDVVERVDLPREAWVPDLSAEPAKKAAVDADARGAAKVATWVLKAA